MLGWIIGQLIVGILCGLIYARTTDRAIFVIGLVLIMIIGNGVYQNLSVVGFNITPLSMIFRESIPAYVADTIPMIVGMIVGTKV